MISSFVFRHSTRSQMSLIDFASFFSQLSADFSYAAVFDNVSLIISKRYDYQSL